MVNCHNIDRDEYFDTATNGNGWFSEYIGTDLQAGDGLEITQDPLDPTTILYTSIVHITVAEINAGALRFDMRFVTSDEPDLINIGEAEHTNYLWSSSPLTSNLNHDYKSFDFALTLFARGHLYTPQNLGAVPNEYPIPPNTLDPALTYQGEEHYEVIVKQLRPSPPGGESQLDSNNNWMSYTFNFGTGTTAHWDPTAKIYINENNANFKPLWIFPAKGDRYYFLVQVHWGMILKQNGNQLWSNSGDFEFTFYGKSTGFEP